MYVCMRVHCQTTPSQTELIYLCRQRKVRHHIFGQTTTLFSQGVIHFTRGYVTHMHIHTYVPDGIV
jgi:hypothetical protein